MIAVQGLASTYEWTWKKRLDNGTHVMWLRDLLPKDLPLARILTFEYDSKWLEDPSFVSLGDCGARLLQSIIWDRTHQTESHMCPKMVSPTSGLPVHRCAPDHNSRLDVL